MNVLAALLHLLLEECASCNADNIVLFSVVFSLICRKIIVACRVLACRHSGYCVILAGEMWFLNVAV